MSRYNRGNADNTAMDDLMSFAATGNALPLLHEVRHALAELLENNKTAVIDLGAIPFAPGDERVLDSILGEGEVHAVLKTLGESHVRETSIYGVWRVDHMDASGEYQSRFIEVTFLPEILKTHSTDAAAGLGTLTARLEEEDEKLKQRN